MPDAPTFEEHCPQALENLRGALTELYLAAGADVANPQEVSRTRGVHRNLAWKVSRIIRSGDLHGIMRYMPGPAGIVILVEAFRKSGAPEAELQAVLRAHEEFEDMARVHAGDRDTLKSMLGGLQPEAVPAEPLELSRKLAFQGNSGIWGARADTRVRAVVVAPNAERPELLDLADVSGLIDLRRFRHDARFPLFHRTTYNDDGSLRTVTDEPIEAVTGELADTRLMPEFCSSPLPEVQIVPTHLGARYEQVGGELGNCGSTTWMQGTLIRRFAPRYRDERNTRGEFRASINAPAENLLFDLVVHADLLDEMNVEVALLHVDPFGRRPGSVGRPIPFTETLRRLESSPPRLATPLVRRYGEVFDRVFERAGWDPSAFRALRFEMKYPPWPSTVMLHYELPQAG